MDKNSIKKFAVWARRELISRVSQKAYQYGITENSIVPGDAASVNGVVLSADEIRQRKALIDQINAKDYQQVIHSLELHNSIVYCRYRKPEAYCSGLILFYGGKHMSEIKTQLEECGVCHSLHPMEELAAFDDTLVCPECMEDTTVVCGRCGERIWIEDDAGNEDAGHLCQSCYDRYYNTCDECHRIICEEDAYYEDDDRVLCYDCHRRHRSRYSINDYSYKPDPIFYGSDTLFMGVEIELDEGGESDNQARKLLEIANAESERIYCKHDGSLNDGFEVVSHPMTLDYHLKSMPWQAVLEKARQLDYRSHQAKTCGLHIHVNRTAFGDNIAEQEEVIARILFFFEKHWEELLKFSRRTHRQMEQWANRYGYKDSPMEILDTAKKGFRGFRYTAVNLINANTIEFRLFRGTLRYNSFIAALQLINRICAVAICLNDEELKRLSWSTFVGGCEQYPELVQYLKERRLFVNEPVQADQEV